MYKIEKEVNHYRDIIDEAKQTDSYKQGNKKFVTITPNYDSIRDTFETDFSMPLYHPLENQQTPRVESAMHFEGQIYKKYSVVFIEGLELIILGIESNVSN